MARRIPRIRKGQGSAQLTRAEFERRYRVHFYDPAFAAADAATARVLEVAWDAYREGRKAPLRRKAGSGFADPSYELSVEWIAARDAIRRAQVRQKRAATPRRILLIIGSPRNDKTCPGEISKSFRLAGIARRVVERARMECDVLDLSLVTSEYGRQIHPCKSCVSTAMPLCHWPCSCYPNHSLGQVHDWMNEIYARWAAAHGVMIITPVHWLHAPTPLKAMIDRMVCADGGNPDPTSTGGKDPAKAKALELRGWDYPRHLAGRSFALVVHGDTEGSETLRRGLHDWLTALQLVPAGSTAIVDRNIGYYEPYATSHEALDRDKAMMEETRNAALSLVRAVALQRRGRRPEPDAGIDSPRPK